MWILTFQMNFKTNGKQSTNKQLKLIFDYFPSEPDIQIVNLSSIFKMAS